MSAASRHGVILAGDIGGTKSAFALFDPTPTGLEPVREATLPSRGFPHLEAAIERFLEDGPRVTIGSACLGVAGTVVDGRCSTTNLPWEFDESTLAGVVRTERVKLLNDLEAAAYGVLTLPAAELEPLQAGRPRTGHMVLIAAGTGLGEAILAWDGRRHSAIASEGGHADFAPQDEVGIDLLRFLRRQFGHVSWERVLSGSGLFAIYRFLRESGHAGEPDWLRDRLEAGDPGAVVSEVGLAGGHPLCVQALDVFVALYGAEAGNLALKALALGGVFVGGGIAPRIRAKLTDGTFVRAFAAKGRFSDLMRSMPIHLVLNPKVSLLGAADFARTYLSS